MTETFHTLEEAAERLRISRRTFQDILKRHPFFFKAGRRKLLTDDDITSISEALRREQECHLNSRTRNRAARRSTASGGHISGSMWTEAQRRLRELRQTNSSGNGKKTSNVALFPGPENRRS
ncbi:MAG TPA: hypothetical protein VFS39_04175 [Nitrospira sp.]|nr:hypothetical protein [Nitrospira sp.]